MSLDVLWIDCHTCSVLREDRVRGGRERGYIQPDSSSQLHTQPSALGPAGTGRIAVSSEVLEPEVHAAGSRRVLGGRVVGQLSWSGS